MSENDADKVLKAVMVTIVNKLEERVEKLETFKNEYSIKSLTNTINMLVDNNVKVRDLQEYDISKAKRLDKLEFKHNALTELVKTDGRIIPEHEKKIKELEFEIKTLRSDNSNVLANQNDKLELYKKESMTLYEQWLNKLTIYAEKLYTLEKPFGEKGLDNKESHRHLWDRTDKHQGKINTIESMLHELFLEYISTPNQHIHRDFFTELLKQLNGSKNSVPKSEEAFCKTDKEFMGKIKVKPTISKDLKEQIDILKEKRDTLKEKRDTELKRCPKCDTELIPVITGITEDDMYYWCPKCSERYSKFSLETVESKESPFQPSKIKWSPDGNGQPKEKEQEKTLENIDIINDPPDVVNKLIHQEIEKENDLKKKVIRCIDCTLYNPNLYDCGVCNDASRISYHTKMEEQESTETQLLYNERELQYAKNKLIEEIITDLDFISLEPIDDAYNDYYENQIDIHKKKWRGRLRQ